MNTKIKIIFLSLLIFCSIPMSHALEQCARDSAYLSDFSPCVLGKSFKVIKLFRNGLERQTNFVFKNPNPTKIDVHYRYFIGCATFSEVPITPVEGIIHLAPNEKKHSFSVDSNCTFERSNDYGFVEFKLVNPQGGNIILDKEVYE